MKLRVIVNPMAGSGRAVRRVGEISRALDAADLAHDVVRTEGPGDAARLVGAAREDGVECVALVGGDGTVNEACQAYIDPAGEALPGPDLALIPAGTGGDFRKTFDLPDDVEAAVRRLADSQPRPIDLGLLSVTADDGGRLHRAFINITSFGIGGLTDRIVNDSPKWMGGRAAFFVGTLRAMAIYKNTVVKVTVDGNPWLEGPIFNVAIANGRYFGGGMNVAPDADPADGRFDVVALGDLSRLGAMTLSRKIYTGEHVTAPGVRITRGARVEATPVRASDVVLIDMDGETPGRLPLTARVAAGAVRIRA